MEKAKWIILVHGMFCHSGVFDRIVSFLEGLGYKCLAVNLPFHDQLPNEKPDPRLGTTSIRDYVKYVVEIIDGLEGEKIIIGHSMGGLIALIIAGIKGAEISSLILLAPAAPWGIWAMMPSVIQAFWDIIWTKDFWKVPIKMSFERMTEAMFNCLPHEDRWPLYLGLKHESGRAAGELGFWWLDRRRATAVRYKNLKCLITVFVGAEDMTTPLEVVQNIVKKLVKKGVNAELVILPQTGHWLPEEIDLQKLADKLGKS